MLGHFFHGCHDLQAVADFLSYIDILIVFQSGCICRIHLGQFGAVGCDADNLKSNLGSHCKVQIVTLIDCPAAFELSCTYGIHRVIHMIYTCYRLNALHVLHGNLVGSRICGIPNGHGVVGFSVQGTQSFEGTVDIILQLLAFVKVRDVGCTAIPLGGLSLACVVPVCRGGLGGCLHLYWSLSGTGLTSCGGLFFYNNIGVAAFICSISLVLSCTAFLNVAVFGFLNVSCVGLFSLGCAGILGLSLGGSFWFFLFRSLSSLFGLHLYIRILTDLLLLVLGNIFRLDNDVSIVQYLHAGCYLVKLADRDTSGCTSLLRNSF